MNDTDLIIGAELLEDNIQMCVYDSELKHQWQQIPKKTKHYQRI